MFGKMPKSAWDVADYVGLYNKNWSKPVIQTVVVHHWPRV